MNWLLSVLVAIITPVTPFPPLLNTHLCIADAQFMIDHTEMAIRDYGRTKLKSGECPIAAHYLLRACFWHPELCEGIGIE